MRVGFPGGPRLEWYDRNPSTDVLVYSASGVAPHAVTVRATYTVPTGKKAWLSLITQSIFRATAATVVGKVTTWIWIAGAPASFLLHQDNTEAAKEHAITSAVAAVQSGQVVEIRTQDAGEGGTMDYVLSILYTEFDA